MTFEPILSAVEADAILEASWNAFNWFTLTEDEKTRLLTQASKMVDRVLTGSRLDVDPEDLAEAVALQAAFLGEHRHTIGRVMKDGIDRARALDFGGMAMSKDHGHMTIRQMFHPEALFILRGHIAKSVKMVRV